MNKIMLIPIKSFSQAFGLFVLLKNLGYRYELGLLSPYKMNKKELEKYFSNSEIKIFTWKEGDQFSYDFFVRRAKNENNK